MRAVFPKTATLAVAFGAQSFCAACSSAPIWVGDNRADVDAMPDVIVADRPADARPADARTTDARLADVNDARPTDAGQLADVADALTPTAGALIRITSSCDKPISTDPLSSRTGKTPDVPICALSTAMFWKSGLEIICSGKVTATCNPSTDPGFERVTTGVDSQGGYLDAASLPYVEVPAQTTTFDYVAAGLTMGSVVAVLYKGQLAYGVVGTEGEADIIGDASYAMADALGIDPNPVTGGVRSNTVTYIAFTGAGAVASPIDNRAEAVRIGQAAVSALIQAGK